MFHLALQRGVGPPFKFQNKLGVLLYSFLNTRDFLESFHTGVRNQCSSGFAAWDAGLSWSRGKEVGVFFQLGWYSRFLVTCVGASC